MTLKQIRELLVLKEWTRPELAARLGLSLNTVSRWFCLNEDQRRYPSPDCAQKMREWLSEAREQSRTAEQVGKKIEGEKCA